MSFAHYKSIKSRKDIAYISISVQPTLKKGDFLHAKYITLEVDDFENEIKTIW